MPTKLLYTTYCQKMNSCYLQKKCICTMQYCCISDTSKSTKRMCYICFHSSECKDYRLLGCDAMQFGRSVPIFGRIITFITFIEVCIYQTTQYHVPEDCNVKCVVRHWLIYPCVWFHLMLTVKCECNISCIQGWLFCLISKHLVC